MDSSEKITSYAQLNRIVECMDDVLKFEDSTGNRNLNFYKIRVKCEIFEKMANLMSFNFGCINFDMSLFDSFNPGVFTSNAEKLLFIQSNEPTSPYFMIGIKPDEPIIFENKPKEAESKPENGYGDTKYIIETLFASSNPARYFKEQEIVIPTQILFDKNDILTKTSATPDQKRKLISMYREITRTYNLSDRLNIYGDYMELLLQQEGFQKNNTKSLKNKLFFSFS